MKRIAPSTGKVTEDGEWRMNHNRYQVGGLVIYRGFAAWAADTVLGLTSTGVYFQHGPVEFRQVVAAVPDKVDPAPILARLAAIDKARDDAVGAARSERWVAIRDLLDESGLEKVSPHIPGG